MVATGISLSFAASIFVGGVLLVSSLTLLAIGRRRREDILLSAFLAAVGLNFVLTGAFVQLEEPILRDLAFALLVLDPLLLLGFVSSYPYQRRPPWLVGLIAVLGVVAVVSVLGVMLAPALGLRTRAGLVEITTWHIAAVLETVVAYTVAWFLAVDTAGRAPTKQLTERAGWLVLALATAIVPRLGLVGFDLEYQTTPAGMNQAADVVNETIVPAIVNIVVFITIVAALVAAGMAWWRSQGAADRAPLKRTRRYVLWVLAAVLAVHVSLTIIGALGIVTSRASLYAFRWLPFAGVLVYGVLAYEVVPFRREGGDALGVAGGICVALGAWLLVLWAWVGPVDRTAVLLGGAVGLGSLVPGAFAVRRGISWFSRGPGTTETEARRLELYRAALETAWASGTPGQAERDRLERDRRAFGVSYQEARALEHVVAADVGRQDPRGVAPGEEPVPGLVVEQPLGRGAHGRVYRARLYPSGEAVVLKELRADGDVEGARRRLLEESRALQRLDHPNIANLRDVHARRGQFLLVLDHVDGRTLAERLEEGPLRHSEVRSLAIQLLDALESAHAAGVLHRDVKPSNILLGHRGEVVLTDFGVAAVLTGPENPDRTATRVSHAPGAGTLAYMAPEQVDGDQEDAATDLYQVGLVLYEALTGRRAHDLAGLSTLDALTRVARPDVDLTPVPTAWRPILERALAQAPTRRYRSASEMRTAVLHPSQAADR